MDDWGFDQLRPWLDRRVEMPVGTLFCVIDCQTRGRPWTPAAARNHLRRISAKAGVRRRFAPHQLRHAHAVEMAREGVSLKVIQRQLGHVNLGITSVYLDGIDTRPDRSRPQPTTAHDLGERGADDLTVSAPTAPARMRMRHCRRFGVRDARSVGTAGGLKPPPHHPRESATR
jgi:hypothetical protein